MNIVSLRLTKRESQYDLTPGSEDISKFKSIITRSINDRKIERLHSAREQLLRIRNTPFVTGQLRRIEKFLREKQTSDWITIAIKNRDENWLIAKKQELLQSQNTSFAREQIQRIDIFFREEQNNKLIAEAIKNKNVDWLIMAEKTLLQSQNTPCVIEKLQKIRKFLAKTDTLATTVAQIEEKAIVSFAEIKRYRDLKKEQTEIVEFASRYYKSSIEKKDSVSNHYSFVKGKFYRLPNTEDIDSVSYALLTKYLYERQRNEYNSETCLNLRRVLNKFIPHAIHTSDNELRNILEAHETTSETYYGDCLSGDSDSEAEEVFNSLPKEKRAKKLDKSKQFQGNAGARSYQLAMDGKSKLPKIDLKKRPVIQRSATFNRRQAKADLAKINERLESDGVLLPNFLDTLATKFVVAQYRGIHYITSKWDISARRKHRTIDERKHPQYSSAVLSNCGLTSYHQYLEKLDSDPDFHEQLHEAAQKVFLSLLLMQHSNPVSWEGFAYVSLFHLLQYWYSANYNAFPKRVAGDLSKDNSVFKRFLANAERPLLSTADIPYHALKYAYGIKFYKGYEDQRLRPRWRKNGQAERPYSGKVYVSLHPLNDYTERNPSHITSMFKQGLLHLCNVIASERETSFLGYLPEDRVVFQHVAKYPFFKGDYKSIYEYKYGISKSMYEKLQKNFQNYPPHSAERQNLKLVLGEYLCAYQEVRLIQKAQQKAEKNDAVLVYRDENGKFSLYHPATPHTANKDLNPIVMAKRRLYESFAKSTSNRIIPLTQEQVSDKLNEALPTEKKSQRDTEWMRFFSSKRTFAEDEVVTPVITFTS